MVVRLVLRAACASYCNNHHLVIQAVHAVATQISIAIFLAISVEEIAMYAQG